MITTKKTISLAITPQETIKAIIPPPNMRLLTFALEGTSPYMQSRFSQKAMNAMMAKMEAGSQAKKGTKREARDFNVDYQDAQHVSTEGWVGIPAGAFRTAMIDACRIVGFKMTLSKLSIFVEPDGFDKVDALPLVRISGDMERSDVACRNSNGNFDIRPKPLWREWSVDLRVKYNADVFTIGDIANLLSHVGEAVGIGEGRHNSRNSPGIGYGCFRIINKK